MLQPFPHRTPHVPTTRHGRCMCVCAHQYVKCSQRQRRMCASPDRASERTMHATRCALPRRRRIGHTVDLFMCERVTRIPSRAGELVLATSHHTIGIYPQRKLLFYNHGRASKASDGNTRSTTEALQMMRANTRPSPRISLARPALSAFDRRQDCVYYLLHIPHRWGHYSVLNARTQNTHTLTHCASAHPSNNMSRTCARLQRQTSRRPARRLVSAQRTYRLCSKAPRWVRLRWQWRCRWWEGW